MPIARGTIKLTYNYLMKNELTQCDSIDYITQGIPKIHAALRRYHIYTRTLEAVRAFTSHQCNKSVSDPYVGCYIHTMVRLK